jgi:DNA-3-methyladenine glycosylase II
VELVGESSYRRSICLQGQAGWFQVEPQAGELALKLSVAFADVSQLMVIVARVRRMFDLDANYDAVYQDLSVDAEIKRLMDATPGLRLPGAWEPFEFVVRAVLGQQISVKAATTIAGRLAARCGTPLHRPESGLEWIFPDAKVLAAANLSGIGLTGRRIDTLQALAAAVASGNLALSVGRDLDRFIADVCALPGIGEWTAQYIAMRALGEPDAFPAADLGLMKALGLSRPKDIKQRAEHWRPWRAYAAIHLWHSLGG